MKKIEALTHLIYYFIYLHLKNTRKSMIIKNFLLICSILFFYECSNKSIVIQSSPLLHSIRPLIIFKSYEEDHVYYKKYEINNIYSSKDGIKMCSIVYSKYNSENLDTTLLLSKDQMIQIKDFVNQVIQQKITQKYNTGVAGEINTIEVELFFPREKYKIERYGISFSLLKELGIIKEGKIALP